MCWRPKFDNRWIHHFVKENWKKPPENIETGSPRFNKWAARINAQ